MANGDRTKLIVLAGFLCAVYFFVFGESGLIERSRLVRERGRLQQKIEVLRGENAALQSLYEKHKNGRMLREEAHRAGFVGNGERVVFLNSGAASGSDDAEKKGTPDGMSIETSHLRILWIVVSMLALLYYFARSTRTGEE